MFRKIGIIALLFILAGCATKPVAPPLIKKEQHKLAVRQLEQWQIEGRLAFKGPEEKFSANLNWRHQPAESEIYLTSFIGTQLVSLRSTPGYAELIADDQHYTDSDSTNLLLRVTGWNIPVTQLAQWIKAAYSAHDKVQLDEHGLVKTLYPACRRCGKWKITYSKYATVQGLWLPHEVLLQQTDQQNTKIRIRINQWLKI